MQNNPIYYGEVQPWAKAVKAIFSGVSIAVFLISLCSTDHNVRSFLRSLFFCSSPIFIDLLVIFYSIKNNTEFQMRHKKLVLYATISSIICFCFPLIILLSVGNNILVIDAFVNGSNWGFCFLFFPLIVFSFGVNVLRPFDWKKKTTVRTEQRHA